MNFVGYAAATAAVAGFSAIAAGNRPINPNSERTLALVTAIGLAAVSAVGFAFGLMPTMTLAGFVFGCVLASVQQRPQEKLQCVALFTLAGLGIGWLFATPIHGQMAWGFGPNGQLMPIFIPM